MLNSFHFLNFDTFIIFLNNYFFLNAFVTSLNAFINFPNNFTSLKPFVNNFIIFPVINFLFHALDNDAFHDENIYHHDKIFLFNINLKLEKLIYY